MIQIYKNYEGHKELEELDHIELESWVMITDPTNGGTHEYFERL